MRKGPVRPEVGYGGGNGMCEVDDEDLFGYKATEKEWGHALDGERQDELKRHEVGALTARPAPYHTIHQQHEYHSGSMVNDLYY